MHGSKKLHLLSTSSTDKKKKKKELNKIEYTLCKKVTYNSLVLRHNLNPKLLTC
jgi:hypothetical protein